MQFTEEQSRAINERKKNILVSAAAGSGKTAVLVERIIQLTTDINNPIDIDRFLIVTFTKAAANEMKERIVEALFNKLEEKPDSSHLLRQLNLLNKAQITTIHSFCLDIIREYHYLVNVSSSVRVADEAETSILKADVIEKVFESEYKIENNVLFYKFLNTFGKEGEDKDAKELVINTFEKLKQISTDPFSWFENAIKEYNLDLSSDIDNILTIKNIKESILIELKQILDDYNNIIEISSENNIDKYISFFNEEKDKIECLSLAINKGINVFFEQLRQIEFETLPRVKNEFDINVKENIKAIRDEIKSYIKKIKAKIFMVSPDTMLNSINEMYPILNKLLDIMNLFEKEYTKVKREKNIIDFTDIEHYTLKILNSDNNRTGENFASNIEVANKIKEKYTYIFVDEYQDINVIQDAIIQGISKDYANYSNVFMVGDVKQSIYKFRQAKPEIFLEKYYKYSTNNEEGLAVEFTKNFRSRDVIIDFVNQIFENIMLKELGGIEYNEKASLNLGASFKDAPDEEEKKVEFELITNDEQINSEDDTLIDVSKAELEAMHIANKIKDLIDKKYIYDKKSTSFRKAEFRDIVILLRSTQNYIDEYLRVFNEYGIPVYSEENKGYFGSLEVQLVINILKTIDNPLQDIPLVAILKSQIFNFTLDELIKIRVNNKNTSFFDAMLKYSTECNDNISKKIQEFITKLNDWRSYSEYVSIKELIEKLYVDTDIYNINIFSENPILKNANLRLLQEKAEQFENTAFKGNLNFVKYIDKLIEKKEDIENAKIIGENDNVVRIMTIHKSKGLEFPIVFLGGTSKKLNMSSSLKESILLNESLGVGINYIGNNVTYKTYNKYIIEQQIKKEMLAEEIRILYVALTRPIEKLYIVSVIDDFEKYIDKKIDLRYILSCKNYIELLLPCVKDNKEVIVNKINGKDSIYQIPDMKPKKLEGSNQYIDKGEEILGKEEIQYYPEKISVSELKELDFKEAIKKEHTSNVNEFLTREYAAKLTSTEKGTIVHKILKHLDYLKINNMECLEAKIEKLISNKILLENEYMAIDKEKLFKFCVSDLVDRMKKASTIYKEVPFVLEKRLIDIFDNTQDKNKKILIQGVIDCYFEEKDDIVLIDYKTDYTEDLTGEYLKNKYNSQLKLYAEALKKALNKKVKEIIIYSIHLNKEFYL